MHIQGLDLTKTHHLGFTFSFPVTHYGLTEAYLIRWTKGYYCADMLEKDVVELMQTAINKRDVRCVDQRV
jgi:hexokinase